MGVFYSGGGNGLAGAVSCVLLEMEESIGQGASRPVHRRHPAKWNEVKVVFIVPAGRERRFLLGNEREVGAAGHSVCFSKAECVRAWKLCVQAWRGFSSTEQPTSLEVQCPLL